MCCGNNFTKITQSRHRNDATLTNCLSAVPRAGRRYTSHWMCRTKRGLIFANGGCEWPDRAGAITSISSNAISEWWIARKTSIPQINKLQIVLLWYWRNGGRPCLWPILHAPTDHYATSIMASVQTHSRSASVLWELLSLNLFKCDLLHQRALQRQFHLMRSECVSVQIATHSV